MDNRRLCETFSVGPFDISVGFDRQHVPCEVFFTGRGKAGHDLDNLLYEIGVKISKTMQGEQI